MDDTVKCTRCDNRMIFGAASQSFRDKMTKAQMAENMAFMVGWSRIDGKWICGKHG